MAATKKEVKEEPSSSGCDDDEEGESEMEVVVDASEEGVAGVEGENPKSKHRYRPRKRRLYAEICKQMEFYFSDANISKNRLMLEMINAKEYVPLAEFLEFNRLKALTLKVDDLKRALLNSEKLQVSEDGSGVKRKVPYDPEKLKSDEELEELTVYVENIPRHVDHAWLEKIFISFGPIAYISLPKFKLSGQPKGFAFIEFENKEAAEGCIEAYQGEGALLSQDMDPSKLMSIQAFIEDNPNKKPRSVRSGGSSSHPGISPTDVLTTTTTDIVSSSRKRKFEDEEVEDDVSSSSKKIKEAGASETPKPDNESENKTANSDNVPVVKTDQEKAASSEKKKKKRKRKNRVRNTTEEEKMEGDSIFLKVMPKKLWRTLRNRYLSLQRKNMTQLKKHLKEHNLRNEHFRNFQQSIDQQMEGKRNPGNIVEILLDTPSESVEAFKTQVKVDLSNQSEEEAVISQFVKYVDYEEGGLKAYVRFGDDECFAERIQTFTHNAEKVFKNARILSVQESEDYKAQVQQALKAKTKKPKKNIRGKDRLLKIAATASSHQHIRFDLEEEELKEEISSRDSGIEPESTTIE